MYLVAAELARTRRRGDLIEMPFAAVHRSRLARLRRLAMSTVRSLLGRKRTSRRHPISVAIDPIATWPRPAALPLTNLFEPLSCHLLSLGLVMRRREFITLLGDA